MAVDEGINDTNDSTLVDSFGQNTPLKNKKNLFQKQRIPLQENFNVTYNESNVENHSEFDLENSAQITKQRRQKTALFKSKPLSPAADPFILSQNELRSTPSEYASEETKDEDSELSYSIKDKSNPFRRFKEVQNIEFSVSYEPTRVNISEITSDVKEALFRKPVRKSDHFQVSFNDGPSQQLSKEKNSQDFDNTSYAQIKSNPFKKTEDNTLKDPFDVEFYESTMGEEIEEHCNTAPVFKPSSQSHKNFDVSFEATTAATTTTTQNKIINSFEKSGFMVEGSNFEIGKEFPNEELGNKESDDNKETIREEVTGGPAITKSTATINTSINSQDRSQKNMNADSYLNQSSFNDENLQCWMSDHSDDEILPPVVPAIPSSRTSGVKEVRDSIKKTLVRQTTLQEVWVQKFNNIIVNANKCTNISKHIDSPKSKIKKDIRKPNVKSNSQPTKTKDKVKSQRLIKPAPFITKRLYHFLKEKLKLKYGIYSTIQAEKLAQSISDTVSMVTRRKNYQKKLISDLKKEMAVAGVVETTVDFYEFIIKFLPNSFRIKVIPCIQPITNTIYPPRDTTDPFDKIL